jgi:hypothetical protein
MSGGQTDSLSHEPGTPAVLGAAGGEVSSVLSGARWGRRRNKTFEMLALGFAEALAEGVQVIVSLVGHIITGFPDFVHDRVVKVWVAGWHRHQAVPPECI